MKKLRILKFSVSILLCALLLCLSLTTAFAATASKSTGLTINGKSVNNGDVITYSLYFSNVPKAAAGLDMSVYFNQKYLKLDKSSISTPNLAGCVVNSDQTNLNGEIRFNASNATDIYDFKTRKLVISVKFTVQNAAADTANISYYVREFYSSDQLSTDGAYLTFTANYDLAVNSKAVLATQTAIVNPSQSNGDVQYGTNGQISPCPTNLTNKTTSSQGQNSNQSGGNNAANAAQSSTGNGNDNSSGVIVIVVILIIAAIAITLFFKKKSENTGHSDQP
ncbi:MAG: hypothetical protein Q8876_07620 [Bacillota bacterium]|nr:hypothetical protein [Bacillota bacterium]